MLFLVFSLSLCKVKSNFSSVTLTVICRCQWSLSCIWNTWWGEQVHFTGYCSDIFNCGGQMHKNFLSNIFRIPPSVNNWPMKPISSHHIIKQCYRQQDHDSRVACKKFGKEAEDMTCDYTLAALCHRTFVSASKPNKSVFSLVPQLSTWHCLHLLWTAILRHRCCWARLQLSIDISCPHSAQQQTCQLPLSMGQMNRLFHIPCTVNNEE